MFYGLIVTTTTDIGPQPCLNLSPISEDITVKLSIIGMTILSMGVGIEAEKQYYRLYGSIPIPDSPSLGSLAMLFAVIPTKTNDIRIKKYGRESIIWLIFEFKNRAKILSHYEAIETILKEELASTILNESNLSNPKIMNHILDRINNV